MSVTGYGESKRTLLHGPWFLVRTQRKISGGNTSLLKKEHKEHLKEEVGHTKRGNGTRMMRHCIFKTGLLHIHLGGCGLTVLIDSCKLHKEYTSNSYSSTPEKSMTQSKNGPKN